MTDSVTNKIILSADSTCDLDQELKERYHVHYFPLHIILMEKIIRTALTLHRKKFIRNITMKKSFQKQPPSMLRNILNILNHGSMKAMK